MLHVAHNCKDDKKIIVLYFNTIFYFYRFYWWMETPIASYIFPSCSFRSIGDSLNSYEYWRLSRDFLVSLLWVKLFKWSCSFNPWIDDLVCSILKYKKKIANRSMSYKRVRLNCVNKKNFLKKRSIEIQRPSNTSNYTNLVANRLPKRSGTGVVRTR